MTKKGQAHVNASNGSSDESRVDPSSLSRKDFFNRLLGGARSGKSAYAEWRASQVASVCYIATAQAGEDEMSDRILKHQSQRPSHW